MPPSQAENSSFQVGLVFRKWVLLATPSWHIFHPVGNHCTQPIWKCISS